MSVVLTGSKKGRLAGRPESRKMGLDVLGRGDNIENKKKLYDSLKATEGHRKLSNRGKEEFLLGSDSLSGDFGIEFIGLCCFMQGI